MDGALFFKGGLVGLILCAPLGPIGFFCARRTILGGWPEGVAAVLGASATDGLYCSLAGLSISSITNLITLQAGFLRSLVGVFFVGLGIWLFRKRPQERPWDMRGNGVTRAFVSTLLITLANPLPIIVFVAVFGALQVSGWQHDCKATVALVVGVFVGSALWAPILVGVVTACGRVFDRGRMALVNKISGAAIAAFGVLFGCVALI